MNCKICNCCVDKLTSAKVLKKFDVNYFICSNCGFIQTEDPYWMELAYSSAIADSDIGLINRNIILADISKAIISKFFNSDGKFLDYGGGYGIFARLMRDLGYDFYLYDKYCPNLFAKGFETVLETQSRYELITAFELLEHVWDPIQELDRMLAISDSILFSTELIPISTPKPGEWWYYSLETGQHVSFYTLKSLSILAEKRGLDIFTNGKSLHLLTRKSDKRLTPIAYSLYTRHRIAKTSNFFTSRKSLSESDYKKILNCYD